MRSQAARHTFTKARRLMPRLGITRVTDITRMDRLGVPVYVSVRPRGLTLRVHSGKALRADEARVGALMEALEYAVAEAHSAAGPDGHATAADLTAQWPGGLRITDFCPLLGASPPLQRPLAAVRSTHLASGVTVLLPAELVLMPFVPDDGPPLFGWSTTGLASGNSLPEATLHALLEVLERDAMALNRSRDASIPIHPDDLPPPLQSWATAWRRDGVDLIVRAVPNLTGLACFEAFVHEPASTDVNLAVGAGLHFDRDIALARAVCEAAQSRLGTIHGGRDDITLFYAKYKPARQRALAQAEDKLVAALQTRPRRGALHDVPHEPCARPAVLLQLLLDRLARRGFGDVFVRRMGCPGVELEGLHVVKVVVPRCESLVGATLRMGPRLLARAQGLD